MTRNEYPIRDLDWPEPEEGGVWNFIFAAVTFITMFAAIYLGVLIVGAVR